MVLQPEIGYDGEQRDLEPPLMQSYAEVCRPMISPCNLWFQMRRKFGALAACADLNAARNYLACTLQNFCAVEDPETFPVNSDGFPRLGHAAAPVALAPMEPSKTRKTPWEKLVALKSGALQTASFILFPITLVGFLDTYRCVV